MIRVFRVLVAGALLAALAGASVVTAQAGGPKILDARLTGIPTAGLVLDGLTGGGVPWVIDQGHARLDASGRLKVEIDGLVLATTGVNPIAQGRAIVTCSNVAAASSPIVPFAPAGDAEVDAQLTLPSPCLAPAVFFSGVLPTGAERWFAVSGS